MAMDTLATASAVLNEGFGQMMHDNVVRTGFEVGAQGSILHPKSCMSQLRAAGQVSTVVGGKPFRQTNHITDPGASWFGQGDPWPTASADGFSEANLNWARIAVPVHLDRLYVNELGDPGASVDGFIDPVMDKLDKAAKQMVSQIERAIHTTQGALATVALDTSIRDNVTYAGIDQALNAYWQASQGDAALAALNVATHLDPRYNELYNNGRSPKVCWTGTKQEQAYEATLQANRRFTDMRVAPDAHYQALEYKSMPVVAIPGFPNDVWYFVDTGDLKLKFLAQQDIIAKEGSRVLGDAMPRVPGQVPVAIIPDRAGTDSILFIMVAYVQFVVGDPSYHGVVINLG